MQFLKLTHLTTQKVPPREDPILVNVQHIRYVLPDAQGGCLLYIAGQELPLTVREPASEVEGHLAPPNTSNADRTGATTGNDRS